MTFVRPSKDYIFLRTDDLAVRGVPAGWCRQRSCSKATMSYYLKRCHEHGDQKTKDRQRHCLLQIAEGLDEAWRPAAGSRADESMAVLTIAGYAPITSSIPASR